MRREAWIIGGAVVLAGLIVAGAIFLVGGRPRPEATPSTVRSVAIPSIPTSVLQASENREAESSLRNALTAGKTAFTDADSYASATVANLRQIEPALTWVPAPVPSQGPNTVSVTSGGFQTSVAGRLLGGGRPLGDGNVLLHRGPGRRIQRHRPLRVQRHQLLHATNAETDATAPTPTSGGW